MSNNETSLDEKSEELMKRTNSLNSSLHSTTTSSDTITETFNAIADQYQSKLHEEDKVITARDAMMIISLKKDIEGDSSKNNDMLQSSTTNESHDPSSSSSHNYHLAEQLPPSLEAAETRPIRNTDTRPQMRRIPSSTSTIPPPPPEAGLRRNTYLPPTPGAVAVNLRYGGLQTQGSEGTIQIGDLEWRQEASSGGGGEQQLQRIVNAVLVSENSERTDQVNPRPSAVNLAAITIGEPVDAVPVTGLLGATDSQDRRSFFALMRDDCRVCSLVALLLVVMAGVVAGFSVAFAAGGDDNGSSSANQNQPLTSGGRTPTPAPLFVPTMVSRSSSFQPIEQQTAKLPSASSDDGLILIPVAPTTQRPDGTTTMPIIMPVPVSSVDDDDFTPAPEDDDDDDDSGAWG
jgi:hypothetical protein